jgi:hypothetical protein
MTKKQVTAFVLKTYRSIYGKETTAKILKTNPNGFDRDPAVFYEPLIDKYGVYDLNFTVAEIIDLIVARSKPSSFPYPLVARFIEDVGYLPHADEAILKQELRGYKRMEKAYKEAKKSGASAKQLADSDFEPELTLLKEQARQALEQSDFDLIVRHSKQRKVEDVTVPIVKRILKFIVSC